MKIAYVLNHYPSLSETFIAREIEALRRRGFGIDVWSLQAGEGAQTIPQLSAAQCLAKPLGKVLPAARAKYWRHVGAHWAQSEKENLAGVQHVHAGWASHPAWIACGASEVLGVPWSFSGHARDLWVEGDDFKSKLQSAKFAACCTRAGTEYLQSIAPDTASRVLYALHGIEISKHEFIANRKLQQPVQIMSVGRLVEKKGFPDLLRALFEINEKGYRVRGKIIGEGPLRKELEQQISRMRWDDELTLTGAYVNEEVIAAMREADLFIMPSKEAEDGDRDGLPNVLLEAAACGLPIVSTRAGAITDFLDESCAWLCEPNNAHALAQAMENAITDYDESLRRAEVARARVEEKFDIEKNIEVLARAFTS